MTLQYLSDCEIRRDLQLYLSWLDPLPVDTCFEAKCTVVLGIAVATFTCMWCSGKGGRPSLNVSVEARRPKYKYTRSGRAYGKYY